MVLGFFFTKMRERRLGVWEILCSRVGHEEIYLE